MSNIYHFIPDYPDVSITAYLHDEPSKSPRGAVLICPGGAYFRRSPREEEPIARYYHAAGLNAFILAYSCAEGAANYAPLIQAAAAIRFLRQNAEKFGIDPKKIFILGFSAGGHLAASAGVLWDSSVVRHALGLENTEAAKICRPDGIILSYPVITGGEFRHARSFEYLCGKKDPSEEERRPFSLELHVDESTAPTFIWHTFADAGVPVENTLLFMNALAKKKVPFEAHVFPNGPHGMSLATEETACGVPEHIDPHVAHWAELSVEWIKNFQKEHL